MVAPAQPLERLGEIQVHAKPRLADAAALVANLLGRPRRDIAGSQIAVAGVLALEEVVALRLGNLVVRTFVPRLQRHPDPAIVAQRFAHQGELGLVVAGDGDAGRMDLREAGIGESGAPLVGAPNGGCVRPLGVSGEIVGVAVAAASEHHRIGQMRFDRAGEQVPGDDAPRLSVDDDQVQHLGAWEDGHLPGGGLAHQGLVGAEQQLLAGLATRVEGP